jgi:hypothetical protein
MAHRLWTAFPSLIHSRGLLSKSEDTLGWARLALPDRRGRRHLSTRPARETESGGVRNVGRRVVGCRSEFHADHLVPYSRGGRTEVCNLVVSCPSCNYAKGTMGDATFRRRLAQYGMGWRDRLAKRGTPPPGDRSYR